MRFISVIQHEYGHPTEREEVRSALDRDDAVVMVYSDGFHICDAKDLVCVGTTPNGHLVTLEKSGAMTIFNTSPTEMRAQRVPLDLFLSGPNDVSELAAVWNEFRQRRDKASLDDAQGRGEA